MARRCPQCGVDAVVRDEHYTEALYVCEECGSSTVAQDEDLKQGWRETWRNFVPTAVATAAKAPSGSRKELKRLLKTSLSRLSLPPSSAASQEAVSLLSRMKLEGRAFNPECVAAACIFVSLRRHRREGVNLKLVSKKLGVDPKQAYRVVRYLNMDLRVSVPPGPEPDLSALVATTLKGAEFWAPDGSDVDNASMLARTHELLSLLLRLPTAGMQPRPDAVVAASFLRYRAELPVDRREMTMAQFSSECQLTAGPDLIRSASRATANMVRGLKSLVGLLPYVRKDDVKAMKTATLLHYLDEVLKSKEWLVGELLGGGAMGGSEEEVVTAQSRKVEPVDDDDELGDVDCYIRTAEEVEAIRPLHDKLFREAAAAAQKRNRKSATNKMK